jgi:DNA-binding SARP family transcriptional activator
MPQLRIYLLGDVRLLRDETLLPPFPTRKARDLFACLVIFRQQAHSRSRLAGTLWPDLDESRAHHNLNTTLWRLRHALSDEYLLIVGWT